MEQASEKGGAVDHAAEFRRSRRGPSLRYQRLHRQPAIPQNKIPADASPEVQALIVHLYASSPQDRAIAIQALGALGKKAGPAAAWLVDLLGDTGAYWQEPAKPISSRTFVQVWRCAQTNS